TSVQPGPPASIAIQVGDNQAGAPNGVLAVKPSVIVRDASGRVVPNATVGFAVDPGSGAVELASVATGGDGVASPGNWTLGPAEGDHRLRATVGTVPAAVFTARATFPTFRVADTTIGPGTAAITYIKTGEPLHGLSLIVPGGSFATAKRWTIESRDPATAPKVSGLTPVAPVLSITTDAGMANQLITLRIPVKVPPGSTAMAFYHDPTTGYLEPIPTLTTDAVSLTVVTRHFSAGQLLRPTGAAALRRLVSVQAPPNIQIVTFAQATEQLAAGAVTSDFELGVDDWEFANHGSYITPNGESVGQSLSAIYYFLRLRDPGDLLSNLSGRFDRGPFWADNPLGYRVAALADRDADWGRVTGFLAGIEEFGTRNGLNLDQAHLLSLAMAMSATKQPQLIALQGAAGPVALIAYQVSLNQILAANPNDPGHSVTIGFSNGKFLPVQMSLTATGPAFNFSAVRFLGVSALADLSKIDQHFQALAAGSVGTQDFPAYQLEYFDEDFGIWKALTGNTLSVAWQDIQVRALCTACERNLGAAGQQAVDIYGSQANLLSGDRTAGSVKFRVPAGSNKIGIHVLGGRSSSQSGTVWRHLDFRYVTVNASKFYVTPDPSAGVAGKPVTLTARNQAAATPTPTQYVWTFGDGDAVTVTGDSAVTHTWKAGGVYQVTVRIKHATTALELGRATATVTIDQPVPIWRLTTWTPVSASGPPAKETFSLDQLIADGNIYDGLLGIPARGLIIFQDQPVQVGPTTRGRGVYLQFYEGDLIPGPAGWDASASVRVLARPVSSPPPAPDVIEALDTDALTDDGSLNAGSFGGRAVNATINAGALGLKALVYWEITAVKNGTVLTGTVKRVQPMYEITGFGGNIQTPIFVWKGDFVHVWNYSATRLK
ncbi:MAG: PKD domain-containing protein, partial [Gemmatimonadales bacterium]|nr:PKD domain-containing protein [Gemmatimonadales bacterium]